MHYSSVYGHLGSFYEYSSISSGEQMPSYLVANLPGSELSKSEGYAYV